jgi:methionine synthase / methylenetetrahydrofolate reductase (NADH)
MAKRTQDFGVPYLHRRLAFTEIVVPEQVRIQIAVSEGDERRAQRLAIAREISRAALERFPEVYLITPFLKYSTTVELAAFARSL